jgi:hypothetical protein
LNEIHIEKVNKIKNEITKNELENFELEKRRINEEYKERLNEINIRDFDKDRQLDTTKTSLSVCNILNSIKGINENIKKYSDNQMKLLNQLSSYFNDYLRIKINELPSDKQSLGQLTNTICQYIYQYYLLDNVGENSINKDINTISDILYTKINELIVEDKLESLLILSNFLNLHNK